MRGSQIGNLYLTATPIGNLSDISDRVVCTLRDVHFIAAEDTRVTRKLLTHLGIKKPLISYFEHNKQEAGAKILDRLLGGEDCALVTDAGTPAVSDPGADLVQLCAAAGVVVNIIPGPCAVVCALALSGFPAGRYIFEGFLPADKKKRLSALSELKHERRTIVFYEAPHKLLRTLTDIFAVFGDRYVSISREITKMYEETLRLTLSEAIAHFTEKKPRGEFVIVLQGACESVEADNGAERKSLEAAVSLAKELVAEGMSVRDGVKKAALDLGCSRNELYKAVVSSVSS
ncbi:MAG: 16S rRNA (cytidine(1402)-2'-O)-methyltransferase [Oscillospiraceae bacterium]|nr:16S rRNA (cytidine(1402)-2'-O)-methyltransferase [Oscillospiraceae bacterium]